MHSFYTSLKFKKRVQCFKILKIKKYIKFQKMQKRIFTQLFLHVNASMCIYRGCKTCAAGSSYNPLYFGKSSLQQKYTKNELIKSYLSYSQKNPTLCLEVMHIPLEHS